MEARTYLVGWLGLCFGRVIGAEIRT